MVFYRNSWSLTPPLWVFPKEKTQSSVQLGTAQSRFTQLFPPRILPARPRPPESSTAQACRQIDLESQFTTYPHCPGGVKRWAVAHAHRCPSTVCLISILLQGTKLFNTFWSFTEGLPLGPKSESAPPRISSSSNSRAGEGKRVEH